MLIIAAIAPPLLWGGWMFYDDYRASIDRRAAMKVQNLKRAKLSAQYRSIEQAKAVAAHHAKVAASEAKRAAARKNRRAAWLDRPSRP